MLWKQIIAPGKPYESHEIKSWLHLSMAALSLENHDGNFSVSVLMFQNNMEKDVLLCSLSAEHTHQCALDLNFEKGSCIKFWTAGDFEIHLTGYTFDTEGEHTTVETESIRRKICRLIASSPPDLVKAHRKKEKEEKEKREKEQAKTAEPGSQGKDEEKEQKDKEDTKKEENQDEMSSGEGTSSGTNGIMKTIKKK